MEYKITNRRLESKLKTSRITCEILAVIAVIFFIMYIQCTQSQKRAYNDLYMGSLKNAASIISTIAGDDFDYDTKYIEACAELNVCTKMVSLAGLDESVQKSVNSLYYSFIKLPNQVRPNLNAIHAALLLVINGDSAGYTQIQTLVDSFDKLDY